MDIHLLNNGLAFVEGFALILSPCILPILPIILSGGMTGGKQRPLGIIIGFTLFFALFALLSGTIIRHIGINLDWVNKISYILIAIFGVILISDYLSNIFSRLTQGLANKSGTLADKNNQKDLFSGILFGGLVSLIWVPCGGPILAAAIVGMAVQKTFLASFMTFLFFALGSVLPMILIALLGKKIISKTTFLKKNSQRLRKIFGIIIVISAVLLGFTNVSAILLNSNTAAAPKIDNQRSDNQLIDGLSEPYSAPLLNSHLTWLNSPPLTTQQLKGKVVLVDFWAFSCINCIRTLPYLRDWYQKYHDKGLVIIGVHTPEFEFEKNVDNVKNAIKQYNIHYPVVLDNDYNVWQSFQNQYWPAHYLIDKNGQVVYQHFGEGEYDKTEHNIRVLLGIKDKTASLPQTTAANFYLQTPETYLGYERAETYQGLPASISSQTSLYHFPASLPVNSWALQGKWEVAPQNIQSLDKDSAIKLNFIAQHVYAVMGSADGPPIHVTILLNGHVLSSANLKVSRNNLYSILNLPQINGGELELRFDKPGVQIYTFTFG